MTTARSLADCLAGQAIGVVGLGLIGGSLGLDLRQRGHCTNGRAARPVTGRDRAGPTAGAAGVQAAGRVSRQPNRRGPQLKLLMAQAGAAVPLSSSTRAFCNCATLPMAYFISSSDGSSSS